MKTEILRFNGAVERAPAIEAWMKAHPDELGAIAHEWFEVMRKCGDEVGNSCMMAVHCMFGKCALWLRQRIHGARERGIFSRSGAAGTGRLAAGHRKVHAPREAENWDGDKRGSAYQPHRGSVRGYQGSCRKRLPRRNAVGDPRSREPPDY